MKLAIDAKNLKYRDLNNAIRKILSGNNKGKLTITNVLGQRYIGDGLKESAEISIYGIPGNDMAAFMDGPKLEIFGNGQDGIGNTMNSGKVIIHGDAGDILGYSMRGGEIYIEKNVGYRCGIHMKSYKSKIPVIVIGGNAGNFLGEYLAGGIIIVLGLHGARLNFFPYDEDPGIVGNHIGTGMHGGTIYIRESIADYKLGKEVKILSLDKEDLKVLEKYIKNYCSYFGADPKKIPMDRFIKLIPYSHRPYGRLYAY
ncbi:hypothetical protein ES703_105926 [subsurface metagenome]